ncbi:uncharacterized protein LOC108916772 [Anoplophora glabripennis]|uniref:uncharacterized protein LOC108916772 n=1 Tax=Anoplophora glabripennis TaxID=217634 RepID=UPI0008748CEE|nr:uncharacterized protein LOC108916772 [Anoplophora glabripennis]
MVDDPTCKCCSRFTRGKVYYSFSKSSELCGTMYRYLKNEISMPFKRACTSLSSFKAGQIINACCVLHNMCVRANVGIDEDEFENEIIDPFFQPELAVGEIFQLGQQQRRQLINLYFQ